MSLSDTTVHPRSALSPDRPICIAILAMGGQGGGVLSDWIVALAEREGWVAQSTSVPGVAQRTGATIYYIELLPARPGAVPVLALMPTPGDVDIVLAAEFMEAGRSVLRGLVTPDRTTLIASTHRSFAVVEKERPGDGIADSGAVIAATDIAARRMIGFDMQSIAERSGTVISSALFGALAGAGVLPFPRSAFEATIGSGGAQAKASLAAFERAFERARQQPLDPAPAEAPSDALPPIPSHAGHPALDALLRRLRIEVPAPALAMAYAGLRKVVDFQDAAYADLYLDRLGRLRDADREAGGEAQDFAFTAEAAKHLANAMAYDDVIRVADLKTRASRFARVRDEVGLRPGQLIDTTEFMHPRVEEVLGTLPLHWASALERRPALLERLRPLIDRGRRVRTGTVGWFVLLYALGGMRRFRRITGRHAAEWAHIEAWLALATATLSADYALAVEILACRRLVKGYSDTHARGSAKFDRVLSAVPLLTGKPEGAAWLRRLKQAALADEKGEALDGALRTVASAYA